MIQYAHIPSWDYSYEHRTKQSSFFMNFEQNKTYLFQQVGCRMINGRRFFLLQHQGCQTMPGFEELKWVFMVPEMDFQSRWTETEIPTILHCRVVRFRVDKDGKDTIFPVLEQDRDHLLNNEYRKGETYLFYVSQVPGDNGDAAFYRVRDNLGMQHNVSASCVPEGAKNGDAIRLTVLDIKNRHLRFEEKNFESLKEIFKVNETYDFTIEAVDTLEEGRQTYYVLSHPDCTRTVRYYLKKDTQPDDSKVGTQIKLVVTNFSSKGWPVLKEPNINGTIFSSSEWDSLEQKFELARGIEDRHLEYKSSFVFSTRKTEPDMDHQLDVEIMQQLAAFMNTDGGTLKLGYRNDGTPCGINKDLKYLNSGSDDPYEYFEPENLSQLTPDKVKLKFRNTITRVLGTTASNCVDIVLYYYRSQLLLCDMNVKPAPAPIYLGARKIYRRLGNTTICLEREDITHFICERCLIRKSGTNVPSAPKETSQAPTVPESTVSANSKEFTPAEGKTFIPNLASVTTPQTSQKDKIWKYIFHCPNGEGGQSSKNTLFPDAIRTIPVPAKFNNKSSRLLFCYANGRVNVLNPKAMIIHKLRQRERRYRNTYNTASDFIAALVCSIDDYLLIHSRDANGDEYIKSVSVALYTVHETMQTQGNLVLRGEYTPVGYYLLPNEQKDIAFGITRGRGSEPGWNLNSVECTRIRAFLREMEESQIPATEEEA